MNAEVIVALITLAGTSLGGVGWFFRNLYKSRELQAEALDLTNKERIDELKARVEELETQLLQAREREADLWAEKVVDARKSESVALAYLRLRERERGEPDA